MEKNLMKFKKGKGRVLHLGRNKNMCQYSLKVDLLESSSAENDLGVLVDYKLTMIQKCAHVVKKGNGILEQISNTVASMLMDIFLSFYSALLRPYLQYCTWFWAPQLRKMKNTWKEFSRVL